MYHLPLLPGYGPNANVRSSKRKTGKSLLAHLSEAEEIGYQGSYFTSEPRQSPTALRDGYIISPLVEPQKSPLRPFPPAGLMHDGYAAHMVEVEVDDPGFMTEPESVLSASKTLGLDFLKPTENTYVEDPGAETDPGVYGRTRREGGKEPQSMPKVPEDTRKGKETDEDIAQVVFFDYGVVVFFGLQEQQEKDILEDIHKAGIVKGMFNGQDWEVEECHYAVRWNLLSNQS